jgi:glycosyltransferase involved in cell wall biosynthesis
MRKARLLGMRTIFDLPIGHWRALRTLLADEHAAWPGWTSPDVTAMSDPRIVDRKDAELAAADLVVVPSNFVRDTLSAYPGSLPRIAVIPFGAPETSEVPPPPPAGDACLRVLFVGGLTLRKGVPYLLDALARTKARVDVTLIGRRIDRSPALDHALARYRWFPSLPRIEILRMMRSSDVFVLPTLFEGFALVVLEAMSQGCAVITTPNSGADSCIVDGDNGFIVPIRSSEAIVRVLERLQDEPALLAAVRRNARARAAEQTWTKYRAAVRSLVLATCREPVFAGASG